MATGRRTPLILACAGCLLLAAYVGTYFAFVKPGPVSGPIHYVIISADGSPPSKTVTMTNAVAYSGVLGRFGVSVHLYDPLLALDRKLNGDRWLTTIDIAPPSPHHGTNL